MIYLVKGITDQGVEWQFSDGPSGRRGSSADYYDLAEGLAAHVGCVIDTSEADFTPSEAAIFASGTLTEGGDVKQAPGASLSGPASETGDAQPESPQ